MINLIPPKARKEVVVEYWVRVVSIWLFTLSIFGLVVSLFLLPVYVLVTSQVDAYASSAVEATEKVAEYDLSAVSLVKVNRQAQMLVGLREMSNFSEMIDTIESLKGEGISLDGFSLVRENKKIGAVKIEGEAFVRQNLVDFRDSLLGHPDIEDIHLPISNLAKDKNLPFSISVTLTSNEN